MKQLLTLLVTGFFALPAMATSPKEICDVQKDVTLVVIGNSRPLTATVIYTYDARLGAEPTDTRQLTVDLSASAFDSNVSTANLKVYDTLSHSLYMRNLKSMTIRIEQFNTDGTTRILSEDVTVPESYVEGQKRPKAPIVCYQYAS